MAIKFNLQEQYLHGRKKYFARVRIKNVVNKNEFIDRMLEYGSSITKADVLAVITVFEETVSRVMTIPHLNIKSGNEDSPVK